MLKTLITRFLGDEKGVTLVEYGIAIGLAVAVGTAALAALGTQINASLGVAGGLMP